MKVMKFGGTSVGSPDRMKDVCKLVTASGQQVFVVLSAMSGTTNSLLEISNYLYKKNTDGANEVINRLEVKYNEHVDQLFSTDEWKKTTRDFLHEIFDYLRSFTKELFTSFEEKNIVAQGEIMSTNMVVNYMKEQGINATLLSALDFMRTDKNAEPDARYIKEKLNAVMAANEGSQIYITQGFICRNAYGEIDNLQRGGSDYTASLIGAAINAEEIQIWTDIDGMHNNDPRIVDNTAPVHQLQFEEAEKVKQQYLLINQFCAKSEVVSHTIDNVDVVGITDDEHTAFINYIHVTAGSINQSFTFEYRKKLNETKEELLALGITEMRQRFGSTSKEIVVPFIPNSTWENIVLTVPQRGDKKTLLELSLMNCKQYRFDRLKQAEKLNPEQKQTRLMKELQEKLQLPKLPYQIECFDNSNISGTDAVAACVVFKALKPAKKHYRKYNIKTVEGPDDYASMKEVVRRRYTRMMEENEPLPNLIITDGGQGQMSVVRSVVEDELHLQIPIAGLAKDNRHRTNELLYGNPPATIAIKTDSELFRILTQIQDEVHRFAITFHRDKRSKHQLHSELDEIKGIGPKTKQLLLGQLKSVKRIQEASIDTLTTIAGKTKAAIIYQHFHPDNSLQTEQ